ncbi:MAG: hypothetical protein GXP31_02365 [Kiritimatiellaeota bacterium]|nr:hypothetical protein [Kiritimatiellota bacterium]
MSANRRVSRFGLFWLLPWLVLALARGASPPPEIVVRVDARVSDILHETETVSANLFGITAFEGFPSVVADPDYRARLEVLRPGCIRLAGNVAWCSPKTFDPAWYDTPAALREFTQVLLFGARYPTGRFLPVMRQIGAEPMCSLGGVPPYLRYKGTPNPADFERWAEYCAAYVGLWKKLDPALRLVQVWNEPNASWYKDPRTGKGRLSAAELHIRMANAVAKAIKARFPDVRVGGPVLCWPPAWPRAQKGHAPWYTWDQWTLPWLEKTAGRIDFFDFHVYNVTPADFMVQVEMLVNAAEHIQNRRLPVWITESNYNLAPNELDDPGAIWRKRILPYERFLLRGVLPQADKIEGNLYHDLHARRHTLLPRGADAPDPVYWLLWVLRDLRGRRVVADSANPNLATFAVVEDDRVTVVVFNDAAEARTIALEIDMPCSYWTGPRVRGIGPSPTAGVERLQLVFRPERQGGKAVGRLRLPARATASINFRMNTFGKPNRRRVTREFFGDRTRLFLTPTAPAVLNIRVPEDIPFDRAVLRIGLLGTQGGEVMVGTLGGRNLAVGARAYQEFPLKKTELKSNNRLELRVRKDTGNSALAVAFASIVLRSHEPGGAGGVRSGR